MDITCNGYEIASGRYPQPSAGGDGEGVRDCRPMAKKDVVERFLAACTVPSSTARRPHGRHGRPALIGL